MAVIKYLVPAMSALSTAYAASCSTSATTTVKDAQAASAIGSCSTYTGNIAVATGAAGGGALDFGSVEEIDGSFTYQGDSNVNTLKFQELKSVGDFTLSNLTGLSSLTMPNLETVGNLDLEGLGALGSLGFGNGSVGSGIQKAGDVKIINTFVTSLDGLSDISEINSITVSDNSHLQEISLSVDKIGNIDIGPNDLGNGGQTASFKNLTSASGIVARNCTDVAIPSLEELSGSLQLIGNTFEKFNATKLTSAGGIVMADNSKVTEVNFPELTTINGTKSALLIANNTKLMSISGFDKLQQVAGGVGLQGNFSTVSFKSLKRIGGALYVDTASDTFDCNKILNLRSSQTVDGAIRCSKGDKTQIGGTGTGVGATSSATANPAVALEVPSDFMAGFTILTGLLSLIM